MNGLRWLMRILMVVAVGAWLPGATWAGPPAQKLPSALLVFPFIEADGAHDTRIELVNLSGDPQVVQCFYVTGSSCNEVDFFVYFTPYQPLSWLASAGLNDVLTGSAVPPFFGDGEIKCVVVPPHPQVQFHNTMQGRATVFGTDGRTVSYNAVGFLRLTDGDFSNVITLNGSTYAQCPDKLHFQVLADQPGSTSELVLVPCTQDLLHQVPTSTTVQFLIANEFEQTFSTSIMVTCFDRRALGDISTSLTRAVLGTDTAHLIVRGTSSPLLGLAIDTVSFAGKTGTAGNEPSFQGGRSATVTLP
jgi:hypothetical protein